MEKTCNTCRFYCDKCVKFNIQVNENYKACNDYAEKHSLDESINKRMQLND